MVKIVVMPQTELFRSHSLILDAKSYPHPLPITLFAGIASPNQAHSSSPRGWRSCAQEAIQDKKRRRC